jgi:hypothetical protein
MPKLLELWLPIIAIIISVVSLILSFFKYRFGRKSFEIGLIPILKSRFIADREKKSYKLSLLNDGSDNIYEIKIRFICRLISQNFEPFTTLHSKNDWNYIECLHLFNK